MAGGGSDTFRGTAASALCRLLRCKPSLLPGFLDQGGMAFIANGKSFLHLLPLFCMQQNACMAMLLWRRWREQGVPGSTRWVFVEYGGGWPCGDSQRRCAVYL